MSVGPHKAFHLYRREFLALLGTSAAASLSPARALAKPEKAPFRQLDLHLPGYADLARRALVLVPGNLDPAQKHPAVVLLHGYGQALHGSRTATEAWRDDYGVARAYGRLDHPPLKRVFHHGHYLSDSRLAALDKQLQQQPFEGLVLICPVTPIPYFHKRSGPIFRNYARWVDKVLLPHVRTRAPVSDDPKRIGLAGVSMGGHVAMELFLRKPKLFGALSLIQAELTRGSAWHYSRRLESTLKRVGARPIQVVTSTRDHYRYANELFHRQLASRGVANSFQVDYGPHTSRWMVEAGSIETLLWQDRVLHAPEPHEPVPESPGVAGTPHSTSQA
jgi:enterochelin esterase-like enzyme